jgi:electron transfer flavoprotein beta subunit
MKILVPIKYSYDVSQMKYDAQTLEPIYDAIPRYISETDKCALEEALKLKDEHDAEVIAVTIGNELCGKIIKDAFAMGASKGYLVKCERSEYLTIDTVARAIASLIKKDKYDLIILGHGSADTHSSFLGPILSTLIEYTLVIGVDNIEYRDGIFRLRCSYEDGIYTFRTEPPLILTVTSEANIPRIPTIRDILRAKKMTYTTIDINELTTDIKYIDIIGVKKYETLRKKIIIDVDSPEKLDEAVERLASILRGGRIE